MNPTDEDAPPAREPDAAEKINHDCEDTAVQLSVVVAPAEFAITTDCDEEGDTPIYEVYVSDVDVVMESVAGVLNCNCG